MNSPKEILIIQTAFLGDVVLAIPMVQTLKNIFPDSMIDFLCTPLAANILSNNPNINNIIKYDKKGKRKLDKFFDVLFQIKNNYDIVLCPHRSARSALLTYFSKAPVRIGFNKNALSFLLTHRVQYDSNTHEIQRNIDLLSCIPGVDAKDEMIVTKPVLYPTDYDLKLIENIFLEKKISAGDKIISFAPCSKWFTKQLTFKKSEEIITQLLKKNYKVFLIGGAEDFEYGKTLSKEFDETKLLNFCGRLSPVQSSIIITKSKVLITTDSAAQHLGACTDTPIILIYGSTDNSFGFYPLENKSVIIEKNNLKCRPCTDHGRKACPLKHFKCIDEIEVNEIITSVEKLSA